MHTCYVTTQIRGVSTDGHCGNGVGSAGTQTRWSGCCRHDDDLAQAQPQSAKRWPSATRIRPDVPARSSHGGALLTAATVLRTDCPQLTRLPLSSLGTGLVPPPLPPDLGSLSSAGSRQQARAEAGRSYRRKRFRSPCRMYSKTMSSGRPSVHTPKKRTMCWCRSTVSSSASRWKSCRALSDASFSACGGDGRGRDVPLPSRKS